MLPKLSVTLLAILSSFVTFPAVAQDFPTVTVLQATTLYHNPGHRPFGQAQKGDQVRLGECTALPGYCQVTLHEHGRRYTGWVNSNALEGVVTTK